MTKLADQLLTKALTLNVKERARLANAIQASVKAGDESELTPAYRSVLKKRIREVNDGTAEVLSSRTVDRLMRERLDKKK